MTTIRGMPVFVTVAGNSTRTQLQVLPLHSEDFPTPHPRLKSAFDARSQVRAGVCEQTIVLVVLQPSRSGGFRLPVHLDHRHTRPRERGTAPADPSERRWHHCAFCETEGWRIAMTLAPFSREMHARLRQSLTWYRQRTPASAATLDNSIAWQERSHGPSSTAHGSECAIGSKQWSDGSVNSRDGDEHAQSTGKSNRIHRAPRNACVAGCARQGAGAAAALRPMHAPGRDTRH